jgi:hypothetical protein
MPQSGLVILINRTQSSPDSVTGGHVDPAESNVGGIVLLRYGNVPINARFNAAGLVANRGQQVVAETDRGHELATLLEIIPEHLQPTSQPSGNVLRIASDDDLATAASLLSEAEKQFPEWLRRCSDWKLQLELIDIEWTLDRKLILYVLNDRGPETTRLALLAAAGGHGIIHVQPVGPDGAEFEKPGGGGCGTGGGCGCGH